MIPLLGKDDKVSISRSRRLLEETLDRPAQAPQIEQAMVDQFGIDSSSVPRTVFICLFHFTWNSFIGSLSNHLDIPLA
jgi:hypothetical protein